MIGVVAHDAGGAEILSSFIRRQRLDCLYCLEGPARSVFSRKLGAIELLPLPELISLSDSLLCGTSFCADLEWQAYGLARAAGKRAIAVLDHWANYGQRFLRRGALHWPHEIWVGDEIAESIASRECPGAKIVLVPNAYFLDIEQELAAFRAAAPSANGMAVLFVSEPLREDGLALHGDERYWGYTEEDALRYFLSNVHVLGDDIAQIVIRPHPQEEKNKYRWAEQEFDLPIVTGENKSLVEQIAACDVVIGCATMAMVVGLIAGKRVISCIPPGGRTQSLPHPEIENMRMLLGRKNVA